MSVFEEKQTVTEQIENSAAVALINDTEMAVHSKGVHTDVEEKMIVRESSLAGNRVNEYHTTPIQILFLFLSKKSQHLKMSNKKLAPAPILVMRQNTKKSSKRVALMLTKSKKLDKKAVLVLNLKEPQ